MTVCYLAHCLLNANAKVEDGARCRGVFTPLVALLRERGCTIRQMPCPELGFAGTRRFWLVREQFDTPAYRAHCRRLAEPVAAHMQADLKAGSRVVVIGIDGSPSMGVELTASGPEWGGRPDCPSADDYPVVPGRGLFTETLLGMLAERGVTVVAVGIGQDLVDYDEPRELRRVGDALEAADG
ncbi:MAG: CD3072 family TudS-related putative desulfidase [Gaiellales bacterium]